MTKPILKQKRDNMYNEQWNELKDNGYDGDSCIESALKWLAEQTDAQTAVMSFTADDGFLLGINMCPVQTFCHTTAVGVCQEAIVAVLSKKSGRD
jgi:hypothetical protein